MGSIASYLDLKPADLKPPPPEVTIMAMQLIFSEKKDKEVVFDLLAEELRKDVIALILYRRLLWGQARLTQAAFEFVWMNAFSPGDAVMWAWTCHQIAKTQGKRRLAVSDIVAPFVHGLPKNEARERLWDQQKGSDRPGGNRLDERENWI